MNYIGKDMTISPLRVNEAGEQVWRVRTKVGRSAEFTAPAGSDVADLFRLADDALHRQDEPGGDT